MDVRRWDRWVEDGTDVVVDGPEVVAVDPEREWGMLLAVVGVSPASKARSAQKHFGNSRHGAVSRIEGGRRVERRGRAERARHLPPTPQTNR